MPPKAKPDTAALSEAEKDIRAPSAPSTCFFTGGGPPADFTWAAEKKPCPPNEEFNLHTSVEKEFDVKPWPSWWTACP